MFTNDELELIKKAVKFYADNHGIEQEITIDVLRSVAECLAVSDSKAGLALAETRTKAAMEKRKNIEERLILLQAKLIQIEDKMVAEDI